MKSSSLERRNILSLLFQHRRVLLAVHLLADADKAYPPANGQKFQL